MTRCLLAITLTLTPAPYTTPKEPTWPSVMTTNAPDVDAPSLSTSFWVDESLLMHVGSPPIVLSAPTATPPPPDPPPYIPTAAELVDELFGWPGRQLVQCESSWNRWAVGRYGERGLFQIHPLWIPEIVRLGWTWDAMFEAEPNIRMAAHIRRVQGLRAWTCWKG